MKGRRNRLTTLYFLVILTVGIGMNGCQSIPEEVPEGLSQAELVQRAQDASDNNNWDAAILYYQTILDRFTDQRGAVMEARYEIAFITYKRGEPDGALQLFQQILSDYEEDNSGLPEWPRVLSEILVAKITGESDGEG